MTKSSRLLLLIHEHRTFFSFLACIFIIFLSHESSRADTTVGGAISEDTIWTAANSPYIVTSNISIQGADGADGITSLTIEPGTTVRFNSNLQITVGAGSGDPAALIAQGTQANPIVFTSNQSTPMPGNWRGIKFYATTDPSRTVLEHCIIEYGGYGNVGQVYINNAAPSFRNCTFSNSSNYDLYYFLSNVGGTVTGCTFNSGIYLLANSTVDFNDNTFKQNNNYPILTYADNVGALTSGNTFTNVDENSYIAVQGGIITKDATWTSNMPFLIKANTTIQGTDGSDGITTLTIEPGATLRFNTNIQLNTGAGSGPYGALIAQGTQADPIIFTSSQTTPGPGNWRGIKFYDTTDDDTSVLNYCIVEYAGAGNQGAVFLNNAKPFISCSTFRYSSHAGIYVYGTGSNDVEIKNNNFSNNIYGIYCFYYAIPIINQNNFIGNSSYGVYNGSAATINAENNWWGDAAGPNAGGDATFGNVDADPWSGSEHECSGSTENLPPLAPTDPVPEHNAIRVATDSGVQLTWTCSDPNTNDTLTYDLYLGTTPDTLLPQAQNLVQTTYAMTEVLQGTTYYWRVIAKDNSGLSTSGSLWCFTTNGSPPDLIVAELTTTPGGGMQANSWIALTATITNIGNGPVVDSFDTLFSADGVTIGSVTTEEIILSGASVQVAKSWYYTGGDQEISVNTDNGMMVTETNESNNQLQTMLSAAADISAPFLIAHSPADNSEIQLIQQISFTLNDAQSTVDDASVMASFQLTDSAQQPLGGIITEDNDTFTFVPGSLPLADGAYEVSLAALDDWGNTQAYSFGFVIDSTPPIKPVITGGTVASGTIQPRPAINSADRVIAILEGTREPNTRLWLNGESVIPVGSSPWSLQVEMSFGDNSFEVYSQDNAGNISPSEWVDIHLTGQGGIYYEYDNAGRIKRINTFR